MKRLLSLGVAAFCLLFSSLAFAVPFLQPTGPAVPIIYNGVVTASGSQPVIGLISGEVDLVYNVTGSVTGTLPTLTFTVAGSDPQSPGTVVSGDATTTTGTINSTSSGVITISPLRSSAVNISWTIGGTGSPTFNGVYVTLVIKSAIKPPAGLSNPYLGTFIADAGNFAALTVNGSANIQGTLNADAGFFSQVVADAGNFPIICWPSGVCMTSAASNQVNISAPLYKTSGNDFFGGSQIGFNNSAVFGATNVANDFLLFGQLQGTMVADAGNFSTITVPGTANLSGTSISLAAGFSLFNSGAATQDLFINPNTKTVFSGVVTGSSGFADATHPLKISPNGLIVNNSGTISNIAAGTCTLSSGQCNAVMTGTQGNSICTASVNGTNQTLVGCDVQPDAGSATAFCQATATGIAGIICIN